MKNKYLLFIFAVLLALQGKCQTIPNAGFESWTAQGSNEAPDGWVWAPSILKSSDAHSGMFAVEIEASEFTNPQNGQVTDVPGRLVSGTPGAGMGATGIEGFSFSEYPSSLTGWYKYQPNGNDTCFVSVFLSKWDSVSNVREIIGQGTFFSVGSVDYQSFTVPIEYNLSGQPDTCVIELLSSNVQSGIQGSVLHVDDLEFVLSGASTFELSSQPSLLVYPNPVLGNMNIQLRENSEQARIVITDVNGVCVHESDMIGNSVSLDVYSLVDGLYFITVLTNERSYQKKFIKK